MAAGVPLDIGLARVLVGGAAVAAVAVIALAVVLNGGGQAAVDGATGWSTLGTRDVHSLAFDPADPQHLFSAIMADFWRRRTGGRSWLGTALQGADAMDVAPPAAGFLQIAGHNVYIETADGGQNWRDVPNNLPGLDLHAFVADSADPSHAWAFSVGFGLFETTRRAERGSCASPAAGVH